MADKHTIGLVGFGRIGRALCEYIEVDPNFELMYALVRSSKEELPKEKQLTNPACLADYPADLVVEAATFEAVDALGETILETSDLMVLSGSVLVNSGVKERLFSAAAKNGTHIWLPHAALLGIDGLIDSQEVLEEVTITATKGPDHLDFNFTDKVAPKDITERTVLYDGPVRGLCQMFPRNFNSHATVALASLGLDETRSKLIADPKVDGALHVISASGKEFDLEITRDSAIEGVTGDYTLVSIWGSIRRILNADEGLKFV